MDLKSEQGVYIADRIIIGIGCSRPWPISSGEKLVLVQRENERQKERGRERTNERTIEDRKSVV